MFTPLSPVFVTISSPPLLLNNPVEAIKTPEPVLSTNNLPPWLTTEPETFTAPFLFSKSVSPFAFKDLPETSIPLEPRLVTSTLPVPKFFIVPAISVPPFAPYVLIEILPLSFAKAFAFKLSVLTSLLNKASACIFERIFVASFTPDITSAF